MNPIARLLVIVGICLVSASAQAKELIRTFSGADNVTTGSFEVSAPWVLDWWVGTDFPAGFLIEIHLVDADTGFQHARVLKTRYPGNGVKLFNEGGRYKFRISSSLARWNLRVEQINEDEIQFYKPIKRGEDSDDNVIK